MAARVIAPVLTTPSAFLIEASTLLLMTFSDKETPIAMAAAASPSREAAIVAPTVTEVIFDVSSAVRVMLPVRMPATLSPSMAACTHMVTVLMPLAPAPPSAMPVLLAVTATEPATTVEVTVEWDVAVWVKWPEVAMILESCT